MTDVYLIRTLKNSKQSLGMLCVMDTVFHAKTLELGWHNNASNISCFPAGIYICKWTRSPRLSRESLARWLKKNPSKKESDAPDDVKNVYTYEITGVDGRAGLRFHSANWFFELKGCVALGSIFKDLNADMELDIVHSGDTIKAFNELMNKKDFRLIVI